MSKGLAEGMIVGNLGADPESRVLPSGKQVTNFNVAVNRPSAQGEEVDWFRIETWGKLAEICSEHLAKGRQVALIGRLEMRKWISKEGTDRITPTVVATNVQFVGGKREGDGPAVAEADDLDSIPFDWR